MQHDQLGALRAHVVRQSPTVVQALLEHVADINDHTHPRPLQAGREDRQQPGHPGLARNGGGAVPQYGGVAGESGEGVHARAAMNGERHVKFAGQRLDQCIRHLPRGGPGRLTRGGGVHREDQARPGRCGGLRRRFGVAQSRQRSGRGRRSGGRDGSQPGQQPPVRATAGGDGGGASSGIRTKFGFSVMAFSDAWVIVERPQADRKWSARYSHLLSCATLSARLFPVWLMLL